MISCAIETSRFKFKMKTFTRLTISHFFRFGLPFNFTIITKFHRFRLSREKTLLRQENLRFSFGMVFLDPSDE